jgi:hypothetical protein
MTDYMLVFADEAEATAILYTSTEDDEGQVTLTPNYYAIDTLGVLYHKAPEPLPDPYDPVPLEGWYVNVRNNVEAPELDAFIVDPPPAVPRRVWA